MRRDENHYIPILKARLGEFTALNNMSAEIGSRYTPLIEFIPTGNEVGDDGEPDRAELAASVSKTLDRLDRYWPTSVDLMVDAHALPTMRDLYPVVTAMRRFGPANPIIPVCRPADTEDPELLEQISSALGEYDDRNVCIRLSDDDLVDDRDEPVAEMLGRVLEALDVPNENADLVVDFGAVTSDSAGFAARIARLVIIDLPDPDAWRSITLAAGGFPSNLDAVPPYSVTEAPRLELNMWRSVRDRIGNRMRTPCFGDYAIAYPGQLAGVPFAPAPQIRYTANEGWLILKGRKTNRRANAQFFDICGEIVARPEFTEGLSWGDEQIATKAAYADVDIDAVPPTVTPGNAMVWRAIGTSHHLGLIIDRLTTQGEP